MRVSVITVCRNSASTIEDTLRSVGAQDHDDIEHIVVDGKSTDGTLDLIGRYRAGVSKLISELDAGIYDAMNKGIALASGEVIGFLNSDDAYFAPSILSTVAQVFEDSSIDACYGDLIYVQRDNTEKVVRYWKSRPYTAGSFRKGWMPAHPTFFVRRRIYERYGGFDLDFKIQSDFELTMRFLEIFRIKARYLPITMVRMRTGGVTNSRLTNIIKGNIEAYRACKKHNLGVSPLFMLTKVISRIPQFLWRPKSSFDARERD